MLLTKETFFSAFKPWGTLATGGISGVMLVVTLISTFVFFNQYAFLTRIKQEIEQSQKSLLGMATQQGLIATYEQAAHDATKEFKIFQKSQFAVSTKPEVLMSKLKKWQKQFKIQTLNVQLGSPITESKAASFPQDVQLIRIPVTLDLKVLKDTYFFDFLEKLQTEAPGRVSLKNFHLTRSNELTPDIVQQVGKTRHKTAYLFDGKIYFVWVYHAKSS